jgi:heptosyltransferase-1
MKVLIIKMSSLGDVLHTLPALTDAGKAIPGIQFDWVVEESFAQIAGLASAGE